MTLTRLYYELKPLIPRRIRYGLRRWLARRQLRRNGHRWPISESAGTKPEGWPGWPDGKKFALVLTHDVESKVGLDRVKQLAELEIELGFRSSFNFVPEGEYRVPRELREELTSNGFEVGVHDLTHDGKLFKSRHEFRERAARINQYLEKWGAVGFRSGFMLNKPDWLHDLHIQYDTSTFDTDPFEPQPYGVDTIFPFWVSGSEGRSQRSEVRGQRSEDRNQKSEIRNQKSEAGLTSDGRPLTSGESLPSALRPLTSGYVELPYTLPQDSTLFLLFGEQSIDIWKRKLDWVVQRGGMALVNVHPDYLRFDGNTHRSNGYPASWFEQFLLYIRDRYSGLYWNALPAELAAWYAKSCPQLSPESSPGSIEAPEATELNSGTAALRGKRAAVLLYSYYPSDPRPRRAAEALVNAGMEVDLVCLRQKDSEVRRERISGVEVWRLPLQKRRESKLTYIFQYTAFLAACTGILAARILNRRYDVVHVHNMPDFLVFAAFIPRMFGSRVILDLHDPMPELMMSIYNLTERHGLVRWLKRLERISVALANLVLTPNKAFRDVFVSRGCPPQKIEIVMNSPESRIFDPSKHPPAPPAREQPFRLMYHGLLVERHGLDTAIEAVHRVRAVNPGVEFHIFGGRTGYMERIDQQVERLGLERSVVFHGHKPQKAIAEWILSADLGIIPNRRNPFTEINMPTRIFEYLAMGKPVIAPRTRGIEDYFDRESLLFFEPDDPADLADRILWVIGNPKRVEEVITRGCRVYKEHLWEKEKKKFVGLVERLLAG